MPVKSALTVMQGICSLALGAFLTVAAQSAQPPHKSIPLIVHVVDAVTGKPRADVALYLQDTELNEVAGPVEPDRSGKAEFRLTPGNYVLSAQGPTYTVNYGQLPDGLTQTVYLAPEDEAKQVTFAVTTPGTLSGYIRDDLGDPVSQVQVHLVRAYWSEGATAFRPAAYASTDDRGYYRITGIKPGSYILCGTPGQNSRAPEIGPVDFANLGRPRYYQRACVPAEPASMSPPLLRISPGQHASADLTVAAAPAVTVRGRVTGDFEDGQLRLVPDSLMREVGFPPATNASVERPEFAFSSVAPGRYLLQAEGHKRSDKGTPSSFAAMPIEVGSADFDRVELALQPSASTELAFQETEPGLAKEVKTVGLRPAEHFGSEIVAQEGPDKVRRFPPLRAGKYWLRIRTTEKPVCETAAQLGDQDAFRHPITLAPGQSARLTLALSSHCAAIAGRVLRESQPAPGARVVVLIRGTPENPGDCWTVFTNSDGGFELTGIAPGRYLIWAWPDDDSGLAVGPRDLASVARYATEVEAREGDPAKPDIPVLNLEKRDK